LNNNNTLHKKKKVTIKLQNDHKNAKYKKTRRNLHDN